MVQLLVKKFKYILVGEKVNQFLYKLIFSGMHKVFHI